MPSPVGHRKKPAELAAPVGVALTNDDDDDGVLPMDMLYEVLLRLPAKELCRLRVVCRSWWSLTSDPAFAKAHASRRPPLVAGIWMNMKEVHILDLTCCNKIVRRLHVPESVYDLSTAQLGLLCVSPVKGCHTYVLDPAVAGESVATLPDGSRYDVNLQQDGFLLSVPGLVPDRASFRGSSSTVLGQVPSTGEYKALRINVYCMGRVGGLYGRECIRQTCNVTTLGCATAGGGRKISWRARPCPPVGGPPTYLRDRVVIDGVGYFLRRSSYYSYQCYSDWKHSDCIEPDAIFAFDLATEEWRPNTLRGPLSSNSDSEVKFSRNMESLQLFVLDGCLVTAHHKNRDCSMDLWFLVDMDIGKGIWARRYSIHCVPHCKEHAYRPPCPLYVLEDGRLLIWGAEKQWSLGVYDPKTNMYSKLASMEGYGSVRMHLGSLLCPAGLES